MGSGYASLSFNRDKEREADYIGIILMAKAGYDPTQAVRVVELVDQQSASGKGTAPPAWLSTHPSFGERISKLYEWEPEALEHYNQSADMDVERIIGL
jgi:predicted Zn-dependent protease